MYWQFELAAFCLICFCEPAKNHTPESRKNGAEKRHGDCKKDPICGNVPEARFKRCLRPG